MQPKQIFALMVGIDKYQSPVPPLEGCVNDMRAFADFVELRTKRKGIPLHLNILENQFATRFKIVEQFEQHLRQAGKDDMVVFYYSGHGSQEPAHKVFWPLEEDRKNETLVTYDSRQPDGMDLADKELATLLDMIARKGTHISVVMDCCNSGSGTRSALVEESPAKTRVRQTPDFKGLRPLDSYILPREGVNTRGAFHFEGNVGEKLIVPTPRHVAMSATQPFELAKETWLGGTPRGVFTYSLLEVLGQAVGPLSYQDVLRQVRGLVKQRTSDQSPQLYAEQAADASLEFLGGSTTQNTNFFYLSHNAQLGWEIDAGATQGLRAGGSKDTRLAVYDQQATDQDLVNPRKAKGEVSVKEVRVASSVVRLEGSLSLDRGVRYRARISQMSSSPLLVHVRGNDPHGINTAQVAIGEEGDPSIYLRHIAQPADANYHVVVRNNQYVIIRPTDADDQPLVEQLDGYSAPQARKLASYLVHIAKWERVMMMSNPGSRLPSSAIKLDLLEPQQDQLIVPGRTGYEFLVKTQGNPGDAPRFRVRLTNRSGEKLFVSLLYLGSQFNIEPSLLAQGGLWLDPGAEAFALNGRSIQARVDPGHIAIGRTEAQETFKVIFATSELNTATMKQDSLAAPQASTRSLIFDEGPSGANQEAWNCDQTMITVRAV